MESRPRKQSKLKAAGGCSIWVRKENLEECGHGEGETLGRWDLSLGDWRRERRGPGDQLGHLDRFSSKWWGEECSPGFQIPNAVDFEATGPSPPLAGLPGEGDSFSFRYDGLGVP